MTSRIGKSQRLLPRSVALSALLLATLALGGCTKLMYDRLDTLAGWYLQSLVSLEETQRTDLRAWLERTLEWHRHSELSRYAQFLRELAAATSQRADRAAYQRVEQQVQQFAERLVDQAAPDAARLLMTLSPAQVAEFESKLAERSRERSEKSLQAQAKNNWHDKRAKDIQRQIKRWTGSITEDQQQLARQTAAALEPTTADWLESQQRWRAALLGALSERTTANSSSQAVEQRILQLLRAPEDLWTDSYRAKNARNRQRTMELIESLDASLTAAQRTRLQRELNELAEQLETLVES